MQLRRADRKLDATHGVIASFSDDFLGYFGWPTVAHTADGTVVAAASGLRNRHECPFGRTVFMRSPANGASWTIPVVIHDSPLDDRDAGVTQFGGARLLVSWFTTDASQVNGPRVEERHDATTLARWREGYARADKTTERWVGSWVRLSDDSGEAQQEPDQGAC